MDVLTQIRVRLVAAGECLAWASGRAVVALEDIERTSSLHAVSAKDTLQSFRDGSLDLNRWLTMGFVSCRRVARSRAARSAWR